MSEYTTKCLIIGSGPAGYTAGIYTSRANLRPLMIEGVPGGQLMQTTEIENFPGYPEGVMGPAMMDDLRTQALRFGLDSVTSASAFRPAPHATASSIATEWLPL